MCERTPLQLACDRLDADLFRLIGRTESLAAENTKARIDMNLAAAAITGARHHIRAWMHSYDIERTI